MPPDRISRSCTFLRSSILSGLAVSVLLLLLTEVGLASTTSASNAINEAQQLMDSAEALRITWRAADLRQATEKYQKAARIWTSIADNPNATLATLKAGDVCL